MSAKEIGDSIHIVGVSSPRWLNGRKGEVLTVRPCGDIEVELVGIPYPHNLWWVRANDVEKL